MSKGESLQAKADAERRRKAQAAETAAEAEARRKAQVVQGPVATGKDEQLIAEAEAARKAEEERQQQAQAKKVVAPVIVDDSDEALQRAGLLKHSSDGKTVSVSGYYRRDGTYVQPHQRAAPGMGTKPKTKPRR
jgi:hypothetical protein